MNVIIEFDTDGKDFKENGVSEAFKIFRKIENDIIRGLDSGVVENTDDEVIGHWKADFPM